MTNKSSKQKEVYNYRRVGGLEIFTNNTTRKILYIDKCMYINYICTLIYVKLARDGRIDINAYVYRVILMYKYEYIFKYWQYVYDAISV